MDEGVLVLGSVITLALGVMALMIEKEVSMLFAFIGAMIGILFFESLNSDKVVTLAYGFSNNSGFSTQTTGIWPIAYVPLFFTILDFAIGLYLAVGKARFNF